MKRFVFTSLIILTVMSVGLYLFRQGKITFPETVVTPSPSTETQTEIADQSDFCQPADLQADINFEPAAGNIYGNLTLKNSSTKSCQINGNNFIQLAFNAKNISVMPEGEPGPTVIELASNQTVYSKVHYPNGPQCSSATTTDSVYFSYNISATESVTFKNQNGENNQTINICQILTEQTEIQVWSITVKPLN